MIALPFSFFVSQTQKWANDAEEDAMRTWGIAGELSSVSARLKSISQQSGLSVGAWMERAGVKQLRATKIVAASARSTGAAGRFMPENGAKRRRRHI
jgi:hypothetical protein